MARTLEGQALTEAHRGAQATISAAVMRQLLVLWRVMDPANIKGSFPAFLELALPILLAGHSRSFYLGQTYLREFRSAEGVDGEAKDATYAPLPTDQATTSLLVTGPVQFLTGVRAGQTPDQALQNALTAVLGSGSRLALSGGRDAILGVQDDHLVGYARVTSGRCCYFCAMLASRGPVYRKDTAGFDAHDHCHCQPEAVYSSGNGEYENPGRADEFRQLYNQSTAGLSATDSVPAFRRAFDKVSG